MKKLRILLLTTYVDDGGAEKYLMMQHSRMPQDMMHVDYFIISSSKSEDVSKFYQDLGIHLFAQNIHGNNLISRFLYLKSLWKFLSKQKQYDALHVNGCSILIQLIACCATKYFGIPIRIVHSHSAKIKEPLFWRKFCESILQKALFCTATYFVGCSSKAGESKYGSKIVSTPKFVVMPNGIDTELFKFSPEKRKIMRRKLGWENNLIVGHIGRFEHEKNHNFLIDIFEKLHEKEQNTRLLLIGKGLLLPQIKQKVKTLGLNKYVHFQESVNNTQDYYMAMDVFCLPSLYEGLPIVGIESQASGLPGLYANTITKELKISKLVEYCSLEVSSEEWAKKLLNLTKNSCRVSPTADLKEAGYDLANSAMKLFNLYANQ